MIYIIYARDRCVLSVRVLFMDGMIHTCLIVPQPIVQLSDTNLWTTSVEYYSNIILNFVMNQ